MDRSPGADSFWSGGSSRSRDLHVSGRHRGIREIDLNFALAEPDADDGADDSRMSEENAMLLASITSLDLSRNEIEHLANLDALRSLAMLDVSYNLVSSVQGLPFTLTHINLSHNRLRDLDGVAGLPHLRALDVSANRLSNLAGLTARMPLKILRADDNRLVSTLGLEDMPDLRVLSLANNFIERLDELAFLTNAVSLQTLSLKNNPVTQLNGYRQLLGQRQAALISLDGAPLLRPREDGHYHQHYAAVSMSSPPIGVGAGGPAAVSTEATFATPAASAHVTPVRRTGPRTPMSKQRPAGDSPLFDDTFLRGMYGSAAAQELALTPTQRSAWEPSEPHPSHPYAEGRPHNGKAGTGEDSLQTPIAERRAPQPTSLSGSTPRPTHTSNTKDTAPTTAAAPPVSGSYARQFESAVAAAALTNSVKRQDESKQPRRSLSAFATARAPAPPPSALSTVAPAASESTDTRSVTARLHDCLVAKEQAEKECLALRHRLRRCEEQLTEARRIVSEQLSELSATRVERDALRTAEGDARERLERSRRHTKLMEAHHKEEVGALQEQFERTKTFYEAQVAELRRQLTAERTRATSKPESAVEPTVSHRTVSPVRAVTTVAGDCATDGARPPALTPLPSAGGRPPLHGGPAWAVRVALPPLSSTPSEARSPAVDDVSEAMERGEGTERLAHRTADAGVLAEQLKGWLYSQMADDISKAEQEELHRQLQRSLEAEDPSAATTAVGGGLLNFPLGSPERAREILETFILQQQQQQQQEPPRHEAVHKVASPSQEEKNSIQEKGGGEDRGKGSSDVAAHSATLTQCPPAGASTQEERAATHVAETSRPARIEEPGVSRARPSLSPQKR